ncbi:hypothetical protein D9M68_389320 [compost metagenome]
MAKGGGKRLRLASDIHQPRLHARHDGETAADEEHVDDRDPRIAHGEIEKHIGEDVEDDGDADCRQQRPIGQSRADDVAEDHAGAEDREHDRHIGKRNTCDLGQRRRDVAEDCEHAAAADGADAKHQPDLQLAKRAELAKRRCLRIALVARHVDEGQRHGQKADGADDGESGPPAERLAEPRDKRRAEEGCDRQPHHHPADCARPLVRRREAGGHQGGHTEIGTMRQAGEEARGDQRVEIRCDRACKIADGENQHQRKQHAEAGEAGSKHRDQRRADDDAESIGADHCPCPRHRNGDILSDLR